MDRGRIKGAIDDVEGSAKRHIGNLTGDTGTQVEGAAQQIKGKVESAVGKLTGAALEPQENLPPSHKSENRT
jgi:uncharacterized protein YjbJ (UPF0337 family)